MTSRKGPKGANGGRQMSAVKRLFSYMTTAYKAKLVVVVVCILISALASVAGSLFLQILIDNYIAPLLVTAEPVFSGLLRAILTMAGIYYIGVAANYIYNRFMAVIGQGVQKLIRDEMFSHMQSLPIRYFDTHAYGDTMSRFTNDIDTLRQMLSQSMPQLFSSVVTIACVLGAMIYTSIPLTLVVLVMVAVMAMTVRVVGGKSRQYFQKQQKDIGKVNGYIEEMMNGQKVVKVFCHEEAAIEIFETLNSDLCETATQANKFANILMPIMGNLTNVQYVLVAMVGGLLAVSGVGALSLGAIASFLQLSRSFGQPVAQVSQQLNSVVMALAGAERIFTLIDEEPEQDDGYVTLVDAKYAADGKTLEEAHGGTSLWAWKHPHSDGTITYTKLTGDVRFFDVDFGYNKDTTVLQNISLYAHPGQKLAFVGATGAGKTTITNLINRFYDIADGKIRYDGININKIKKSDLRRSLGVVLQDTNLFTGTVMENIRYGNLKASDQEVVTAATLAGADSFITRLPEGYNTEISGDGSGLSQGQRQLLSIARAAVADPPVMILDEATSSIDTRTEAIVQRGMDALMYGRTVFVIAHRLSTIQNANAIMVMEHGHIIERGSHEELIASGGKYYQLYTGVFELE